jgi:uncharacterized membrane protein YkoI
MKNIYRAAAVLAIMGSSALSTAARADMSDARALQDAKITLQQAIAAAEKHQGGQSIDASIDDDSFSGPSFEVSIFKEGRLYDVQVDGKSGEVTGVREDHDD